MFLFTWNPFLRSNTPSSDVHPVHLINHFHKQLMPVKRHLWGEEVMIDYSILDRKFLSYLLTYTYEHQMRPWLSSNLLSILFAADKWVFSLSILIQALLIQWLWQRNASPQVQDMLLPDQREDEYPTGEMFIKISIIKIPIIKMSIIKISIIKISNRLYNGDKFLNNQNQYKQKQQQIVIVQFGHEEDM